MGDTSIIARRLRDGHVQYEFSGNGGYFKNVGFRLALWYQEPDDVEYLFGLGQTKLIGQEAAKKAVSRMVPICIQNILFRTGTFFIFSCIVKLTIVFFFQCLNHMVSIFVIWCRDFKFLSHADQCTGKHINFRMSSRIQIL